jgi:multimeric flavodoxin WrbA
MVEALLAGLKSSTDSMTNIFLSDKDINSCKGCYSCWFKTPGICVMDDDMKKIIELMRDANILIFASPLYFNNISGTLKVFIDRLTAAGGDPHKKANGQSAVITPKIILMSNCGFPYRSQFDVVSLWIKHFAGMMQAKLIGEFYTTNGKVLSQPAPEQQKSRSHYLSFLETCGRQYSEYMELKEDTKLMLDKNVLDF